MSFKRASPNHINFRRGCIGLAFLRRDAGETEIENQKKDKLYDRLESQTAAETREWNGVFSTLYLVVLRLLEDSHSKSCTFSHCEICFYCSPEGTREFGNDFMISCGTQQKSGVQLVARRFNHKYKWVFLTVTEAEMHIVVKFLCKQINKGYDLDAATRVYTNPRPTVSNCNRWYCSELVMSALKMLPCPKFHEHRSNCVEVDDIYVMVQNCIRVSNSSLDVSPFRIAQTYSFARAAQKQRRLQRAQNYTTTQKQHDDDYDDEGSSSKLPRDRRKTTIQQLIGL